MTFTHGYAKQRILYTFLHLFDDFNDIPQLSPTDRSLQTEWEQEIDDAKEYVRKLNVISTNKDKEMEVEEEKDDFEVCFARQVFYSFSEQFDSKDTFCDEFIGQLRIQSEVEFV